MLRAHFDYATGEGNEKSHLRNQKEKSRKRLFLFVLFTIHSSLFTLHSSLNLPRDFSR